jgi:hypothetical protein
VNLNPKTRATAVENLRPGHVVMESAEYPAVITRITTPTGKYCIHARYVWQDATDKDWLFGTYAPGRLLHRALEK